VPHVVAVEPDERMRVVLTERSGPGVEILAGRAEQLPAEATSIDAVLASSAWHWVDEARAVPEVARVLRPGGRLALVWNGPNRSVDWMRSLWAGGIELGESERASLDEGRRRRHVVNVGQPSEGPFLAPETRLFTWTRPMSKEDLVALAATYSAVITMEEGERRRHLDAMRRYLDTHEPRASSDEIEVPMRAYCWRAARR
jgi:SAM-dependent methyltransferase